MTEHHDFLYEFGSYTLDGRERVLRRDGQPVPLAPKAFDTLLVLLRNSGHLVEKDQLMNEVWPSTYVEEANLTQNISVLRKALGEGLGPSEYIETIPRRGYRFLVSVRRVPDVIPEVTEETGADAAPQTHHVLAILPFVNASADEDMDYLSEGITESIIQSLSHLPQLRVMSRNSVFRYRGTEMDAQRIGRELGVDAVLVGRVQLIGERLHVKTELVDVANGWQLWGENYDRALTAILEVQEAIAKQISAALRLKLTGEDQQRLTKRYTESGEAYQAYLQGRFHWSKFTREGLEQATDFFRQAIYLDPNYALAYAGIVDCYLRLATNYLPPADSPPKTTARDESNGEELSSENVAALEPVQTRYRWDWTGVERELKRAAELQSNYPAAHQWQAAYLFSLNLYRESLGRNRDRQLAGKNGDDDLGLKHARLEDQIRFASPTPAEEVQVFCTIAREQIEAGNYEGGCQVLKHWWTVGEWPRLEGLSYHAAGDLLFTAGSLTGWVAGAKQIPFGQRHAEALLNGSIGIFEHLGLRTRAAEGKIELGYCYYREGIFDLARATLLNTLSVLTDNDIELKSVCLIRLAITERQAGRHEKSVSYLREASQCVALIGPRVSARHHQELATALRDVGSSESRTRNDEEALGHYQKALSEFEAVGNHRYAAVVENNHGCMLLSLARLEEGEGHLLRARSLFEAIGDKLSRGQVDESVAQLHLASKRNDLAESAIASAVEALESCGYQAVLSEALKTQGVVLARLGRHREAKWVLDRASQIAERCGDNEGAGRALLVIMEEMTDSLVKDEKIDLVTRIKKFLAGSQNLSTQERLQRILERLKS